IESGIRPPSSQTQPAKISVDKLINTLKNALDNNDGTLTREYLMCEPKKAIQNYFDAQKSNFDFLNYINYGRPIKKKASTKEQNKNEETAILNGLGKVINEYNINTVIWRILDRANPPEMIEVIGMDEIPVMRKLFGASNSTLLTREFEKRAI